VEAQRGPEDEDQISDDAESSGVSLFQQFFFRHFADEEPDGGDDQNDSSEENHDE